ncbi:MAG TPA: permease [Acidobacteriota bacterium]|nr:permease [Acidobacteriota bacterium]HNT18753.1 permease [Acidobacteriota bacterium]HPA27909.1 permease [Acidobacteriota bacterium]HQO21211.1 permease [Acidobacteriota bacterium]HQQ47928.1 permease [Acidobacteriota bacterium]
MNDKLKKLSILGLVFLAAYFVPFHSERVMGAVYESLFMLQEYAREHVILCLIPAILIAGGIAVFISQASVIKYFGAKANKFLSYGVASVSGTILAVCSCTVLPLFGGIYYRGAGLGPATAFLYSGPAINVLAIVLTARILGWKMGLARALAAIFMSVIIGLLMHFIFIKEERARVAPADDLVLDNGSGRALWKSTLFFFSLVGVLVFANWGKPAGMIIETREGKTITGTRVLLDEQRIVLKVDSGEEVGVPRDQIAGTSYTRNLYSSIYDNRFFIAGAFLILLFVILFLWFDRNDMKEWMNSSWDLGMQIIPLLFIGVVIAGLALGRPGKEALIPSQWIAMLVGGNSLWANLFASISGALMYFATLTEVPILQGLMGSGMGKGPALALLLSGPAVSLPSMLVLRQVMGTKKMLVYVSLVILFSTVGGFLFGMLT